MKLFKAAVVACALIAGASAADAAIVVNVTQSGNDVKVDMSGSLDLTGLTFAGAYSLGTGISASNGYVSGGSGGTVQGFSGFSSPATFGTGAYVGASTSSGDNFALNARSFGSPIVFLPFEYFPGTELSATQTFRGQTIASLGLTAGSYVFQSAADTVTVNIGPVAAAVPEPATWALMILGMGAIGFTMRRRSKIVTTAVGVAG